MKKRDWIAVLLLSLSLLLAGCSTPQEIVEQPSVEAPEAPQPTEEPPMASSAAEVMVEQFTFTTDNFPRLDGSTATRPLGQALAAALLGLPREQCATYAEFSGTNLAYYNLAAGEADLLLVYELPEDAAEYLREQRVELEIAPIGRDALVFLVNQRNLVENLTTAQLRAIYSGEITSWRQLGGPDQPIQAFQRNPSSGSQTLMQKLVMGDLPMAEIEDHYIIGEMGGLMEAIASYNNAETALGYNVYYFVSQMQALEEVKLLQVDGVAPDNQSIRDGSYPFVNDFYAVIRADAEVGSPARILYDWLQSPAGQSLISLEGYVNLN